MTDITEHTALSEAEAGEAIVDIVKSLIDEIERLRGELDALKAAPPSVPEGWQLVPVEPTTDMICEMERQWMCGSQIDMAKREWKAALATAPKPGDSA